MPKKILYYLSKYGILINENEKFSYSGFENLEINVYVFP